MNWSYIAGLFDGEGSAYSNKRRSYFAIVNCNKEVLEKIQGFVGRGSIYVSKRNLDKWKISYKYVLSSNENVSFILKKIIPYLIIKKQRCEKIIEIIQQKKLKNEEAIKKRFLVTKQVKKLKRTKLSNRKIGRILGINHTTVAKYLK